MIWLFRSIFVCQSETESLRWSLFKSLVDPAQVDHVELLEDVSFKTALDDKSAARSRLSASFATLLNGLSGIADSKVNLPEELLGPDLLLCNAKLDSKLFQVVVENGQQELLHLDRCASRILRVL